MKKQKVNKVKQVKKAIGRLNTPPPQIIPDKREKLLKKAEEIIEGEDLDS